MDTIKTASEKKLTKRGLLVTAAGVALGFSAILVFAFGAEPCDTGSLTGLVECADASRTEISELKTEIDRLEDKIDLHRLEIESYGAQYRLMDFAEKLSLEEASVEVVQSQDAELFQ